MTVGWKQCSLTGMCYSAMVAQNAKKYGARFLARVQPDFFYDLFRRRSDGEKLYISRSMEAQFLLEPDSAKENEISTLIRKWHDNQIPIVEEELLNRVLKNPSCKGDIIEIGMK